MASPPSVNQPSPNSQGSKQPTEDTTNPIVASSQSNPISKESSPLSARNTKKVLVDIRDKITDIETLENFMFFCNNTRKTLEDDFKARKGERPALGEPTTKQTNKKRLLMLTSGISAIVAVASITILILSLTAVIPYILPVVIAISIAIALSISISCGSFYDAKFTKPDLTEHIKKDVELNEALLDFQTFDMITFLLANPEIKKIIKQYKPEQLQELATYVINSLEDNSIHTEVSTIFSNINAKTRVYLDPLKKQDDPNWLAKYQALMTNVPKVIIGSIFQRIETHITDKKLKDKIISLKNEENTQKSLDYILSKFEQTFNELDINDSISSKDKQKDYIKDTQEQLSNAAKAGLKNGFQQYFEALPAPLNTKSPKSPKSPKSTGNNQQPTSKNDKDRKRLKHTPFR